MSKQATSITHYCITLTRTIALLFRADKIYTILLTIILLIQSVIPAAIIYLTKIILDAISDGINLTEMLPLVMIWFFVLTLDALTNPWLAVIQGKLGETLMGYLGLLTVEKAMSFPGLLYFENAQFYDTIEFIKRNTGWRPVNLLWYLLSTLRQIITVSSILTLLSTIIWWVPILLIIATIPQVIVYARLQKQTYAATTVNTLPLRQMETYRRIMTDDTHAKEIRIFGLSGFFKGLYVKAFQAAFADIQRIRVKQAVWSTILLIISILANTYAFYYSLQLVHNGVASIGSILIFVQSLSIIQQQLGDLAEFGITGLLDNLRYMQRLFEYLQLEPDLPLSQELYTVPDTIQKGIHFDKVSFTYPDGRQALKHITLTLYPNQIVAIVGENGAGKSTLVKLLARFYDPTEGFIYVDDVPLSRMNLQSWRSKIAPVFQDFNKYPLTIADNIQLGNLDGTTKIENTIRNVQLENLIESLPNGLDTLLGKVFDGTELSGGQWQKVAIARAFARQQAAQLLILDEPTAALDPRSEATIFDTFATLSQERLTLLITHRLASVRLADRILVMKDGYLIEDGTHDDLLAADGEYAALWQMQSQFYQPTEQ